MFYFVSIYKDFSITHGKTLIIYDMTKWNIWNNQLKSETTEKKQDLLMQMYYLMRIGLTGPQINNVVDISRTTVWRWTNANKWIYDIWISSAGKKNSLGREK